MSLEVAGVGAAGEHATVAVAHTQCARLTTGDGAATAAEVERVAAAVDHERLCRRGAGRPLGDHRTGWPGRPRSTPQVARSVRRRPPRRRGDEPPRWADEGIGGLRRDAGGRRGDGQRASQPRSPLTFPPRAWAVPRNRGGAGWDRDFPDADRGLLAGGRGLPCQATRWWDATPSRPRRPGPPPPQPAGRPARRAGAGGPPGSRPRHATTASRDGRRQGVDPAPRGRRPPRTPRGRGAVQRDRKQTLLGVLGGDPGERTDLRVRHPTRGERRRDQGKVGERMGDAQVLAGRAQAQPDPPVQPVRARSQTRPGPALTRVELGQQLQETACGRGQLPGELDKLRLHRTHALVFEHAFRVAWGTDKLRPPGFRRSGPSRPSCPRPCPSPGASPSPAYPGTGT